MKNDLKLKRTEILLKNNREANEMTRKCIESALVLLMETKKFEEITISNITKKAGVSRTAYYRNYTNKEDILGGYMKNINRTVSEVLKQFDPVNETKESWRALLNLMVPLAPQYKLLLDAGFFGKMIEGFASFMNENTDEGDAERYYANQYWAGAIMTVLSAWIQGGMKTSPEKIAEIGANLMTKGIKTVKEYGNTCK